MSDLISLISESILEGLELRPVSKHLVEHLLWDLPLSTPECIDFGVDTADHYRALAAVLKYEADEEDADEAYDELRRRITELDQAYGNGSMLNALVRKYAPEYADGVKFLTSWDVIFGRTEEDPLQSG